MKSKIQNLSFILLCLFAISFSGCDRSQKKGNCDKPVSTKGQNFAGPSTVSGIVVDGTDNLLIGIKVTIKDAGDSTFSDVTDAMGYYKIKMTNYKPPYTITAQKNNATFSCWPDPNLDNNDIVEHVTLKDGLNNSNLELDFMKAINPSTATVDNGSVKVKINAGGTDLPDMLVKNGAVIIDLQPNVIYKITCIDVATGSPLDSKGNDMTRRFKAPADGSAPTTIGWTFIMK